MITKTNRHTSYTIWLFTALVSTQALAAESEPKYEPDHYDSAFEAIDALGDYTAASQQLEQLEDGVRITPLVDDQAGPQRIDFLTTRAAVYAVYRTFVHTDAEQVHVVAYPIRANAGKSPERLDTPTYDFTATRRDANQALNLHTIAYGLDDLVTGHRHNPNAWSYYGHSLLSADDYPGASSPGARVMLDELQFLIEQRSR